MCIRKISFRLIVMEQKMRKSLVTMQTTFRMQLRQSMNKLMLHLSADKEEVVIADTNNEVDNEKAVSGQEVI